MPKKGTLRVAGAIIFIAVLGGAAYLFFRPEPPYRPRRDEFDCDEPPELVQLAKKDLEVGALKFAKVSLGQLSLKSDPSLVNLFPPNAKNLQVVEYYVCRERKRAKDAGRPMTEQQINYFRELWAFMAAMPAPNADQISTWQDKHPPPIPPAPRGQLHVYPKDVRLSRSYGRFTIKNIGDAPLHWWIESYGQPYFLIDHGYLRGDLAPDKDADVEIAWLYAHSPPPKKQFVKIYADPSPKPPEKPAMVGLNVDPKDVAAYETLKVQLCSSPNADTAWQMKTADVFVTKSLSGVSTPVHKFVAGQMLLDAGAYHAASNFLDDSELTNSDLARNSVYLRYRALANFQTGNDVEAANLFEALAKEPKLARSDTDTVYATALALDSLGRPERAHSQFVSWTASVQNSGFKFKAMCDNPRLRGSGTTSTAQSILENLVETASKRLKVAKGGLRSNVFLLCGDGYLRIPKGFSVHMENETELSIRIPVGFGSTGAAFQNQRLMVTLLNPERSGSCAVVEQNGNSASDWRRALLPAAEMAKVNRHLAWIVSEPIMSTDHQVIGVLNIDSLKATSNRADLEGLKSEMTESARGIAKLLESF